MSSKKLTALKCEVNHIKQDKQSCPVITKFIITIEGTNLIVGTGTVGGRWTPENCIKEFKKSSARFQTAPIGFNAAKAAGLLAA